MHRVHYRPLFADVDAMQMVYYGRYLRIFEFGRAELLRSTGHPYARLENEGLHLPVTEAHLRYRKPARYDDPLVLETSLTWLKKASMRFAYRLLRQEGQGGEELLVEGYTEHACISGEGRVRPLPAWVAQALGPHLEPRE